MRRAHGARKFKTFDPKLVEKIGKDRIGKDVWRSLDDDEKMTKAFEVITDPKRYADAMKESNFDVFLSVLSKAIGSDAVQEKLIEGQIKVALKKISSQKNITEQLYKVYQKTKLLAKNQEPTETAIASFQKLFSDAYEELEESAFVKFDNPTAVDLLAAPMQELIRYYNLAATLKWKAEGKVVVKKMISLIRRQIEVVTGNEKVSQRNTWKLSTHSSHKVMSWDDLSPLDWISLLGSFNLLGCDAQLNMAFNNDKVIIDLLKHKATAWTDTRKSNYANFSCLCGEPLTEVYRCNKCYIQYIDSGSKESGICKSQRFKIIKTREGICCGQAYQVLPDFDSKHKCKRDHHNLTVNNQLTFGPAGTPVTTPFKSCSYCSVKRRFVKDATTVCCTTCQQEIIFGDVVIGNCCKFEIRFFPSWLDSITLTKKPFRDDKPKPSGQDNRELDYLAIPKDYSDPKHFEHLIWKFADFLKERKIDLLCDYSNGTA
jgi:hypothetical protein